MQIPILPKPTYINKVCTTNVSQCIKCRGNPTAMSLETFDPSIMGRCDDKGLTLLLSKGSESCMAYRELCIWIASQAK
jgi:hypothetical protein